MFTVGDNTLNLLTGTCTVSVLQMCANENEWWCTRRVAEALWSSFFQALRYLAECRANREKMKSELGMMLSLQNVIQK